MPTTTKKKPTKPYTLVIVLDNEDKRLLEDAAQIEKLNKSDAVRRAIRLYARKLRSQLAATG